MRTLFFILFCLFIPLSFSQEVDLTEQPYGLFDSVADWGTDEFPPKLGSNKVPGKVDVSIAKDDYVYDVFGNGDDIWYERDEGIYVYTMKSGSWSLSAQVEWIESGRNESFLQGHRQEANVQIRSYPASTSSPNFRNYLRSGTFDLHGGNCVTGWREYDLALSSSWWNLTEDRKYVFERENGLFMRVTRIEPWQYLYTEWSHDGVEWFFGRGKSIEMPDTVGYGLSVTNTSDNLLLAHARFSHVKLEPAPPVATRLISQDHFEPNMQIQISLHVLNPTEQKQTAAIHERIPDQWTLIQSELNPAIQEQLIVWELNLEPGLTHINYTLRAPADTQEIAVFQGTIGRLETVGASEILYTTIPVSEFSMVSIYRGVFAISPFIMFVLHISLFIFNPKVKQNLFYALFLLSISIVIYMVIGNVESFGDMHHYIPQVTGFFAFSNCMFLLFLYSLVYQKLPIQFWVFASVFFPLGVLIQTANITNLMVCFNVLYSLGIIESCRIVIDGLRKKIEGFQIIAVGMFVYGLTWFWGYVNVGVEIPGLPFLALPVSFLMLLLCMSIYMSYWFTLINRNLEKLTTELELRVEHRTRDISDTNAMLNHTIDQLALARDEAEAANKAKSQFLARMSHEIRTPLTGLLGMSELLHSTPLNSRQKTFLQSIRISGESLLGIINEILDFSKIEANRIQLDLSEMNLYDTLAGVVESLRILAIQKSLRFEWTYRDEVPRIVMGDSLRIKQIFSNLIGNAIKFTQTGYIKLMVQSVKQENGQVLFQFEVQDTGIGIPKEAQEKVFDAFSQGDESTTRKFGGTGLGLAIAKHLVMLMNGEIRLESEQGKGTVFYVNIPFIVKENPPDISEAQAQDMVTKRFTARVLLAEDDPVVSHVSQEMLLHLGCICFHAANGLEAVKAFEEHAFDLVLLDFHMPLMDGLETAREIRKIETERQDGKPPIPIIAVTANVDEQSRRECLAAGMNDVLKKPFLLADIQALLHLYAKPQAIDNIVQDEQQINVHPSSNP